MNYSPIFLICVFLYVGNPSGSYIAGNSQFKLWLNLTNNKFELTISSRSIEKWRGDYVLKGDTLIFENLLQDKDHRDRHYYEVDSIYLTVIPAKLTIEKDVLKTISVFDSSFSREIQVPKTYPYNMVFIRREGS